MIDATTKLVPDDPAVDNAPLLDALIAGLARDNEVFFPAGSYHFLTPPKPIARPVVLRGSVVNGASLIRNYSGSTYREALLHCTATVKIAGLGILAGANTSHGGAILLEGSGCSRSVLEDLYVTVSQSDGTIGHYSGTWDVPVTLSGGGGKLGIREAVLRDVSIFGAMLQSLWCLNVQGLHCDSLKCYEAGGMDSRAVLQDNCSQVTMLTYYLTELWCYKVTNLTFIGMGNTEIHVDKYCVNVQQVQRSAVKPKSKVATSAKNPLVLEGW